MKINQLAQYLEWVMKFAYLNILWLGFTLLGVGLFGFFPATMTSFILLKSFIVDGETEWTAQDFFICYKKLFFRSNKLGCICWLILGSLGINFHIVLTSEEPLFIGLRIPILLAIIGTLSMLVYVFPINVYWGRSIYQTFFSAGCFALAFPVQTAKVLAFLILIACIGFLFPMFLLFFSGSVSMYLVLKNYVLLQKKIDKQSME